MSPSILIRDLAINDLSSVAKVHQSAFSDSVLSKLGIEAVRRYYEWQLVGPHDVVAIGAFTGPKDTLVGFCFGGIFRGAISGFLKKNKIFLIWRVVTHPWLMSNQVSRERISLGIRLFFKKAKRLSISKNSSKGLSRKSFVILSIATAPQYQHRGTGKMLMDSIELVARERGFEEMELSVHPENQTAIRFYEGLGWEKTLQGKYWQGTMKKLINKIKNHRFN